MRSIHLFGFLMIMASLCAMAQTAPAHPEMLVSTDWLAAHLQDDKLVVVEIGPDVGKYNAGHISSARYLSNKQIVGERDGLRGELLPDEQLIANLEALGISNDSHVVIYASEYPTLATRLYWTLDYLGIADNASLLDGGIEKWKAERRLLSTESPAAKPGKIAAHLKPEVVAKFADVSKADAKAVLLDTRSEKRYADGHIPGALPSYWQHTVKADAIDQFTDPREIAAFYQKTGLKKDTPIITYCETGFQATHTYFTLKYLGYENVRMYDGSFQEWNEIKHQPVVKGDQPK